MRRLTHAMFLLLAMASPLTAQGPATRPATTPTTLRDAARGHFLIGAAVMSGTLRDRDRAALLATQFSQVTTENELKPAAVHPQPRVWRFEAADQVAEFARQHDLKLVGHTLLWHQQCPDWFFAAPDGKPLSRDVALQNLREHIEGVMKHMKGKVIGWDVVNEAISDQRGQYLRDTPALRAIGEDYLVKAFEFARAADPDVLLFYNDYSIEIPAKREKALRLLRSLKAAGVKVDGVGIQGHWQLDHVPLKELDDTLTALETEGLKVHITELDLDVLPRQARGADVQAREAAKDPYPNACPPEILERQARQYAEIFRVLLKHDAAVERVTFWNLTDRESWLNQWPTRGRTNYPLLFDRNTRPKPAWKEVMKTLAQE